MVCPKCGKIIERSYNGMCQGCYKYFKSGGKIYPLPAAGKVEHNESGIWIVQTNKDNGRILFADNERKRI